MNIEIKSNYNIIVPVNKSLNFDIKDFISYIKNTTYDSSNQLIWDLQDYICDERWDELYDKSSNDVIIDYDSIEFSIENREEIIKYCKNIKING